MKEDQQVSNSKLINENNVSLKIAPITAANAATNTSMFIGSPKPPTIKRNKGAFSFFKSAFLKIRPRDSDQKPKPIVVSEEPKNEKWMKIVGSMRPLHLQDKSPPPSVGSPSSTVESFDDLMAGAPYSPTPSYFTMSRYASSSNLQDLDKQDEGTMSRYASSSNLLEFERQEGTMSSYASANNLQDLINQHYENGDNDEQEADPDVVFDSIHADEMIDVKAEEFIAQFYQSMKLEDTPDNKGKEEI